jgi:hypothetical protein
LVAIAIVAFGSGSLASIAVTLGDPLTGQFHGVGCGPILS